MASAQLALPIERRNGNSARPTATAPPLPVEIDAPAELVPPVEAAASMTGPAPVVATPVGTDCAAPEADTAGERWGRRTTTTAVVLVALVAAVASYEHMRALAAVAGEDWRSWLLPVSVDGLAVAASMTMLVRRRAGLPAGALAWAALLLGLGASLAANVAAAEPTLAGRLVAAWPPVALLLSYELLMQQIKARGGPGIHPSAPVLSTPSNRRNS